MTFGGFILIIVVGVLLMFLIEYVKENMERKRFQEIQMLEENTKSENLASLERQYGKRGYALDGMSRDYPYPQFHFWVFEETKKVVIFTPDFDNKKIYSFSDILRYEYNCEEKETIIPASNETTYTTETSVKSLAGRAIVGAAIAGPLGAVIGGATAKRKTVGETKITPEKRIVNTFETIVLYTQKEGVEEEYPYDGYSISELKNALDKIIASNRSMRNSD